MISLTPTVLKNILPTCQNPEKWVRPLNDTFVKFEINTPLRQAAFLAQVAIESNELNTLEENLNYAPGRLTAVWPKRFPDAEKARPYSRNPEKLANAVYAHRLGNGDEASRDGYLFRGRGLIQVTGRTNYATIGKLLDIDLINMPDTLLEPKYAALSAGAFWHLNKLNSYADHEEISEITYRVSGNHATDNERAMFYGLAKGVLSNVGVRSDQSGSVGANNQTPRSTAPTKEATGSWFE